MKRHLIHIAAFVAGLAAVCWIGAGYATSNLLAFSVTLAIGGFYLAGAQELYRYREATGRLAVAVAGLSATPPSLAAWLEQIPPRLRNAVRLRIEGEPAALPGPALTPHLVGLLVLLGMLGTFLGMVATLRGTGLALESVTDLQAIRASIAAPVKGLGFAFGTSVAGVATSAMLGLLAALCRREAVEAAQMLDTRIATTLRPYSRVHQREESFRLMQRQADAMPALVDRLQAMMAAIEQQNRALAERLAASQQDFHNRAEAAYTRLASSVEQSLKDSVADSVAQNARAASAAIQPAVESTLAGLARETASWRDTITGTVKQELEGLSRGFAATTADVAHIWNDAVAAHRQTTEAMTRDLHSAMAGVAATVEQRSAALLDTLAARMEAAAASTAEMWNTALARHEQVSKALAEDNRQALAQATTAFGEQATTLVRTLAGSNAALQDKIAAGDAQRLDGWSAKLDAMIAGLHRDWEQTSARAARQQQQICDTLAATASDIASRHEAQASQLIGEVTRLVAAATEAPQAAAAVIAELRQKLTDGMARDNAMLEERGRLLETLGTLLDAVNHASTEQRAAVDALVSTTSDLLDRVGNRFTEQVDTQSGKLAAIADQVTGSAVEVASLGEAFGAAVQLFSDSNDKLLAHLERIEAALDKSMARSDDQLAYYVAQAREVVDLSILSQRQILEDLQHVAGQRPSRAEAA